MSNGLSRNSADLATHAQNWNQPNGLGWQVWRRAQSTGLLTQPIQRDLARLRTNILNDPARLASDIRRRWGVDGNTGADRFGLDLPLFLGHSPFFRGSTSHHLSGLLPETVFRSTDTSQGYSPYGTSRSPDRSTFPSSSSTEVDTQETSRVMAPQSGGGSDDTVVGSVARRVEPLAVSLMRQRIGIGRNSSLFDLPMTLPLRRSPLPEGSTTTVGTVPLNTGTRLLSAGIVERYKTILGSQQRSRTKFPQTDDRSDLALMQPLHEASAPLRTTVRGEFGATAGRSLPVSEISARGAANRGGELRTGAQYSPIATAQPRNDAPDSASGIDLQPTNPPAVTMERTILRTALPEPMGKSPTGEQVALTTSRESTISTVKGKSTAQRQGVGDVTTLQPGAGMTGVILRGPETRSPGGVTLPPSAITPRQYTQLAVPYRAHFIPSFSARGFVPTLFRSTYGPARGLDPAARTEEVGARISASSSVFEGSVGRNAIGREQPLTDGINAPGAKIQTDTAETKIAPSTGLPQTTPATFQRTAVITRPLTARANREPGLPTQGNEGGIIRLGGDYDIPVFTARKTAAVIRLAAMPLTISPIFKRHPGMTGALQQRIFPERSVGIAPTASRAEDQGPPRFDNSIRGDETGEGISVSSAGGSRIFRTREGSDNNLIFGPLLGRAATETTLSSGDSTRTSGITSPAQSHGGKLPGTNAVEASIFRTPAWAGFGKIRHSDPEGSLQGWLPLHQSGLSWGNVYRAGSLIQRAAAPLAEPLSVVSSASMRTAIDDQLPGVTTPSQAIQSTQTFSSTRIPAMAAVRSSEIHLQTAGLTPVLAPMRPITITRSALMRRSDVPARQEPHAPVPEMRGTAHEMPFAALAVMRDARDLAALHRSNGTSLQTAPQGTLPAANRLLPIDGGAEPRAVESPAVVAQPQVDLDELVEKTWRKFMRKLTIEQERRGGMTWR
jgi:hypothetical protein